jgi:TM2 domain-containing membrane protein YozV
MNCANHIQTAAVAYCRTCGKALCESCKRPVRGAIYCEDCLASRVEGAPGTAGGPAAGVVINPDAPNPAIATLLGFIPGVGAMYCGEFMKGLIQILIFAALIAAADRADFFGVLVAFWYFYMVFDAYRTAKAKQLGQTVTDPFGLGFGPGPAAGAGAGAGGSAGATAASSGAYPSAASSAYSPWNPAAMGSGNRLPIGAFLLIGVGLLLMLENVGFIRLHVFGSFWPVLLIVLGVYLFFRRRQRGGCQCARCTATCGMGPAVLVTLGVLFLLDQFTWRLGFRNTWPILLVVIGVIGFLRSSGPTTGHIEAGAAVPEAGAPVPPAAASGGDPDNPEKQSEAYRG